GGGGGGGGGGGAGGGGGVRLQEFHEGADQLGAAAVAAPDRRHHPPRRGGQVERPQADRGAAQAQRAGHDASADAGLDQLQHDLDGARLDGHDHAAAGRVEPVVDDRPQVVAVGKRDQVGAAQVGRPDAGELGQRVPVRHQ